MFISFATVCLPCFFFMKCFTTRTLFHDSFHNSFHDSFHDSFHQHFHATVWTGAYKTWCPMSMRRMSHASLSVLLRNLSVLAENVVMAIADSLAEPTVPSRSLLPSRCFRRLLLGQPGGPCHDRNHVRILFARPRKRE